MYRVLGFVHRGTIPVWTSKGRLVELSGSHVTDPLNGVPEGKGFGASVCCKN